MFFRTYFAHVVYFIVCGAALYFLPQTRYNFIMRQTATAAGFRITFYSYYIAAFKDTNDKCQHNLNTTQA